MKNNKGMMTIEVTPSHTRRHTRRHFAKSISTDGTEGKLTRNIQEQESPPVDIFCISQEANDTVSNFLKCLSDKSTELWATGPEPEPEEERVRRIGEVADGVFQVSELHETGGYLQTDQETDRDRLALLAAALRRSQSTGDLEDREEEPGGEPSPGLALHQSSTDLEDGRDNPRAMARGSTVCSGPGLAQSAGNVSGGVRRNRPKMVRQNHIDIDSDSSESKSHLLPWHTNTLPLPSKKHKERLARDVTSTHQLKKAPLVKEIVKKEKEDQKIKDKNRSSRHRKSSLVVHPDQLPILRDKSPSRPQYATLPHKSHSVSHSGQHQAAGAARTNVQKRRRKSHGLTIKIESPTTGEDSSAGIIDTSTMHSSASNIYLSGVSISRGHSPLSSPGPGPLTPPSPSRQGRSPSLSMPPASPLARNSRMRSASLAVAPGHRTPPHSPGCLSLAPSLSPFRGSGLCHFSFPHPDSPGPPGLGSLNLHAASSASTLSSVLHIQEANLSSDDFHESMLLNKLQKTPKKRRKSKKSRSNSKDLTLN